MIDIFNRNNKEKIGYAYAEIEEDQEKKLLEDRIEFKLWSAQQHFDKLRDIGDLYGNVIGKYRVYAEDELDCYFAQIIGARDSLLMLINDELKLGLNERNVRLDSVEEKLTSKNKHHIIDELIKLGEDKTSWYWMLNEFRNRSIHRGMLSKLAHRSITEDINKGTSSSSAKDYLHKPPDYETPMEEEIVSYLSTSLRNMRNLLTNIREKMGSTNNMINDNSMSEEERNDYIFGDHIRPVINRFSWLEGALLDDIQTFVNAKQQRTPDLVVGGGNLSIAIIVCTGLELASALYTGNTRYRCGNAYNAEDNVKEFINNFYAGPAREIPRLIWDGVRNGVDHLFNPKSIQYSNRIIRFTFYAKIGMMSYVSKDINEIRIHLNSVELYNELKRAIGEYKIELQGTKELQDNFISAWDSIESHKRDITNQQQRSREALSLLTKLQASNFITLFH
jgi:tetrahydromethanopterin S-methyltransferase subunit G